MGFWDSAVTWLTGRDPKQADLYADFEKVELVKSELKNLNTKIDSISDSVTSAYSTLNGVKGMNLIGGPFEASVAGKAFEGLEEMITSVSTELEQKAASAKDYSEAPSKWSVFKATAKMAGAKFAEGGLSVIEEIGDGALSLVGWFAPKGGRVEQWCERQIKREWSHDAFNGYYQSEEAKLSLFTEDSAIAGAFKLAGNITGYALLGGAAGQVAKLSNFTKTARIAASVAKGTFVGMGTAGAFTESGLEAGKEFDTAARTGILWGTALGLLTGRMSYKAYERAAMAANPNLQGTGGVQYGNGLNQAMERMLDIGRGGSNLVGTSVASALGVQLPAALIRENSDTVVDLQDKAAAAIGKAADQFRNREKTDDITETPATTAPTTTTTAPTETPTPTPWHDPGGPSTPTTATTAPTTATTVPATTPTTPTVAPTTPTAPAPGIEPGPGGTPGTDQHGGGGYGEDGYTPASPYDTVAMEDVFDDTTTSVDDIIKGKKYAKVPSSSVPLPTSNKRSGNAIIPIAAGLSAAAAAGIGAKAYIDRKNSSDNGEDDDDEIYTDEWDGDENTDIEMTFGDDATKEKENYLDDEDDLSYQDIENESYIAKTSDEIADLQ